MSDQYGPFHTKVINSTVPALLRLRDASPAALILVQALLPIIALFHASRGERVVRIGALARFGPAALCRRRFWRLNCSLIRAAARRTWAGAKQAGFQHWFKGAKQCSPSQNIAL